MTAQPQQKTRRPYRMHGDSYRKRLLKERGTDAIDGRTRAGKRAKQWQRYAIGKKGGRSCPIDVREKIDAGMMFLWRALELRAWIVADARKRGTPVNRRSGKLPTVNEQYDTAMNQFLRINDELELGKGAGLDLARRIMLEKNGPMTPNNRDSTLETPLTESGDSSERCANPLCCAVMEPKRKHAPVKLYCGDKCRQDMFALKRAKALLAKVGVVRFHALLDKI